MVDKFSMIVVPIVIMWFIGLLPVSGGGNGLQGLGNTTVTNPYNGVGSNNPRCSFWSWNPLPTYACHNGGSGNSLGLSISVVAIVAIVVALALTGVQVLGSGLSDATVLTILTVLPLSALFGLFSVEAFPLLLSIPYLGLPLESGLIAMYCLGILRTVVIG
jgi:hypothetical protein